MALSVVVAAMIAISGPALPADPPSDVVDIALSAAIADADPGGAEGAGYLPAFADFRPSKNGFAFVNSFRGSPLPISLGKLESRLNVPERFGLCGGMSFAAADYFLAGRNLREEITLDEPPENGTPLYNYLYSRQAASLAPLAVMATKFVEWMDLPEVGTDGTHARTLAELEGIIVASAAGEPVLLGLVLADGARVREVWRNHQVLLYSVNAQEGDAQDGELPILRIYDPNYPDCDDAIIRWTGEGEDARWERQVPSVRRTTRVRGFFRMPYTPIEPPEPELVPPDPEPRE